MSDTNDRSYYVYVYIDPRNLQEFYYGKGKGVRLFAHLADDSESEKAKIIRAIKNENREPIIRIIAKGLTEQEAFLVEKTLIWRLGKTLTNQASGHFADKFRPHNTLHKELFGFDYANGIFYVNVGEGDTRSWDDCKRYGFLAAGQNWKKWGSKLYSLQIGDIVVAYLKKFGFVGIGRITARACPVNQFRTQGKSLRDLTLVQPNIYKHNVDSGDHLVEVDWIKSVTREEAKWVSKKNLFTTQLIVASLEEQPLTLKFLEESFDVKFDGLLSSNDANLEAA